MATIFDEKIPNDPTAKLMYYIHTIDLVSTKDLDPFKNTDLMRYKEFNNYEQMNLKDQAAIWDMAVSLNPFNINSLSPPDGWLTRFYYEPLYELAKKFNIWPKIKQVYSKLSSLIAYEANSYLFEDAELQEIEEKNDQLLKESYVANDKVAKLMFYLSTAVKEGDKNLIESYSTCFDLKKLSNYENYVELSKQDKVDMCTLSLELHPETVKIRQDSNDWLYCFYFEPVIQLHKELNVWKRCLNNYWNYREIQKVHENQQSN